ncbi:hypothetical protein BKA56DRAFT_673936 [Ilyonectria sp. MPI-CAGE-AT-0026]|nr:hypothetical protein BKA56DRAFT_673936 [Ilyonectria sp. MPI-CAGE-AT-0026]
MAIHYTSNGAHGIRKQKDCAVNAPMKKKSLANAGSGSRSPGPWAKRCYTKQASVQEDDPRCAKVRNRDASSKASKASKINITTCYPQPPSPRSRLPFTTEDQLYLHHRLPLQKPTTAKIARLHFAHLAFVYQDLADRSLARASMMTPGPARERRQRMGVLAARLAKRYRGCRIVLSDQFIKSVISRHAGSIERRSRFWETVLDEVEKANASWSLTRLWILIFSIQSTFVISVSWPLPQAAQTALMAANAVSYTWSAAVLWEMAHARYFATKADEQELHDLMGGL